MSLAMQFENRFGESAEFRRDLRRHLELGFSEHRTQARIAERLEPLGYRLRLGCEAMREEERLGLPSSLALADTSKAAVASGARLDLVHRMGEGMTGLLAELSSGGRPVIATRFDVDAPPPGEARNEWHRPHVRVLRRSTTVGCMRAGPLEKRARSALEELRSPGAAR